MAEDDDVAMRPEEEKDDKGLSNRSIGNFGDTIPRDLMIEILARLPAKSLKRFQCVSKEWLCIIQSQVFISVFNSVSRTRSRFLVAVRIAENHVSLLSSSHGEIERSLTSLITELEMKRPPAIMGFLASASQLTNLDITMSRVVTDCARSASLHTSLDMTMSGVVVDLVHCSSVNGIFGTAHPVCPGRFTICNPTTRQVISLPDIDPSTLRRVTTFKNFRRSTSTGYLKGISLFLGYDPVNNEYKALCSMNLCHTRYQVYKVLTLGGGGRNLSWRDVNKDTRVLNHLVITNGICINGVVYYGGWTSVEKKISNVYCFDVRSERMGLAASDLMLHARKSLINYNGKLGVVYPVAHAHSPHYYLDVLDEFEQELTVCRWRWSHHRIDLHPLLTGMAGSVPLRILGTNDASELIVGPVKLPPKGEPLNIFYCKTVGDFAVTRRVELEGFEQFGCNHPSDDKNCVCQIFISPEHFENLVSL